MHALKKGFLEQTALVWGSKDLSEQTCKHKLPDKTRMLTKGQ